MGGLSNSDSSNEEEYEDNGMRSFKTRQPNRNRLPDPKFAQKQRVWLTDEDAEEGDGSCCVTIAAAARWNKESQQWTYQLRLSNGNLHKDGEYIAEKWLNLKQKD